MRYRVQFVTHTILAECLQTASIVLRAALLKAYATQKISEVEKELYECIAIHEFKVTTHRHLCNRKIVSYEAECSPNLPIIIIDDENEMVTERECRRTIQSSHSYLTHFFGNSCNDFSDMKYHSRELEIVFDDYRLIINPREDIYSIQYKKRQSAQLVFLKETMTLEASYTSLEGVIHANNPLAIKKNDNTLIGVASFLDSKDLSVKTTYLKYKNILTLYQRVGVDDYSKAHPFILELEDQEPYAAQLYLETAWRLDAKLPTAISEEYLVLPPKFKPIYHSKELEKATILPKLDGYPATLRFYETHFIISNSMRSDSFPHNLSPRDYHVIKDYRFLVESELYQCPHPPNAMAIIDIQTGAAFTAKGRYEIIQQLKTKYQNVFCKLNIFFNSEQFTSQLSGNGTKRKRTDDLELRDGKIYEVLLNKEHQVVKIIRERKDKLKPNSGKLIRTIMGKL